MFTCFSLFLTSEMCVNICKHQELRNRVNTRMKRSCWRLLHSGRSSSTEKCLVLVLEVAGRPVMLQNRSPQRHKPTICAGGGFKRTSLVSWAALSVSSVSRTSGSSSEVPRNKRSSCQRAAISRLCLLLQEEDRIWNYFLFSSFALRVDPLCGGELDLSSGQSGGKEKKKTRTSGRAGWVCSRPVVLLVLVPERTAANKSSGFWFHTNKQINKQTAAQPSPCFNKQTAFCSTF